MFDQIKADEMRAGYARALVSTGFTVSTPKSIIAFECARRGVTVDEIMGRKRHRAIAHPRQEIMAALRERTTLSLPAIGRLFGRDHTTVLHALRAVAKRRAVRD